MWLLLRNRSGGRWVHQSACQLEVWRGPPPKRPRRFLKHVLKYWLKARMRAFYHYATSIAKITMPHSLCCDAASTSARYGLVPGHTNELIAPAISSQSAGVLFQMIQITFKCVRLLNGQTPSPRLCLTFESSWVSPRGKPGAFLFLTSKFCSTIKFSTRYVTK